MSVALVKHLYAALAEKERRLISSQRTRDALAAKKAAASAPLPPEVIFSVRPVPPVAGRCSRLPGADLHR
jgi:hypothetical protein